jgi:NADH-quinone oxidoreductase subunit E
VSRLTPDRVATAREIIDRYPVVRSALIPLIHLAQEQDGYVAADAMEHIAELIGCTPAEVYGTGSFYEMFVFEPIGRYRVNICTNISCLLNGGYELLEHAEERLGVQAGGTTRDNLFTLEEVECIAACTEAPCLQVNYRYFHQVSNPEFDQLVDDLRAGKLDEVVPAHGVLARTRQHVGAGRWAATGTSEPPRPTDHDVPALGAEVAEAVADHPDTQTPPESVPPARSSTGTGGGAPSEGSASPSPSTPEDAN